ncbi:MFS transporter [Jatrophihabitans endophyticus]|uniref:MFS transporter n=1 Tax=Jatrophihabitans endophyticus TaxID=1206085 RepID=UPI0019DED2AC|nr:MFS transporter [Jatrophihabitans endophyticus]MBE7188223.1 MFS transporter [Jatrophihabitans endophyticus]
MARLSVSALHTRNYRLFFTGQMVSVSGTWMESVAQSFLVLALTGSGTQLGLVIAVRFGPMFLFGPWGGLIADRLDNRRTLMVTQTLAGTVSLAFAVLVGTQVITMPLVYLLSLCLGFVNVFDNPARQSLIPDLVPREQLVNAVTLNSVTMNVARILGATFGGVIAAAVGLAWCFGINAISFSAVLVSLLLMHRAEITTHERVRREAGQVRAGFRYVAGTPELLIPLVLIAVAGTLAWEFPVSMPLMARNAFGGDAVTYGTMTAAMGVGGVVGGLVSASRTSQRMVSMVIAGLGWGTAITLAAIAPNLALEYVVLVFVGYGSITFNSLAKTTLQLAAAPEMRGRVMALWAMAWLGSTPIGGPIIGTVGEHLGARWALGLGGVATVAISAAVYPRLRRVDRRRQAAAAAPAPAVAAAA